MATIEIQPESDSEFYLIVGGKIIVTSECPHVLERMARLLHQAREASSREAMRILTTEIGMCENYAEAVRLRLHDNTPATLN